jgi:hypothetical protein
MESPRETYKYLSGIANISKIANDVLFEKYIIQNRTGPSKIDNIEDTDQESLLIKMNGGYPVIGLIYTFIYKPAPEEINAIMSGKKLERYTDHVPLVFCTGVNGKQFSGINLNVLPLSERLSFLQMYYENYISYFKDIERKTQNDVLVINKKFLILALSRSGNKLIKMWSDKANATFSFGYRKYNLERIIRLRSIEIEEWKYIPFFESENATKLMNITKVHNLYWKNQ